MYRRARARTAAHRRRGGGLARWAKVALVAAVALAAVGAREGFTLPGLDWLPGSAGPAPIRAGINVAARADCRVARVIDGDTVDFACPGEARVRARLLGFDTPEVTSPQCASEAALGQDATRALRRRIRDSREIHVAFRGTDHYGRRLARLSLDGADVAASMVAEGLARPYDGGRRRSWCG